MSTGTHFAASNSASLQAPSFNLVHNLSSSSQLPAGLHMGQTQSGSSQPQQHSLYVSAAGPEHSKVPNADPSVPDAETLAVVGGHTLNGSSLPLQGPNSIMGQLLGATECPQPGQPAQPDQHFDLAPGSLPQQQQPRAQSIVSIGAPGGAFSPPHSVRSPISMVSAGISSHSVSWVSNPQPSGLPAAQFAQVQPPQAAPQFSQPPPPEGTGQQLPGVSRPLATGPGLIELPAALVAVPHATLASIGAIGHAPLPSAQDQYGLHTPPGDAGAAAAAGFAAEGAHGAAPVSVQGGGQPVPERMTQHATRMLVGSRKRRSASKEGESEMSTPAESWSFLPGTTKTGKRRRRHPVAEVKGNWTPEEDAKLMALVQQHGVGCWSKLLPEFQGRIGKQLRERWNHELRPDINKEGWSHEEELDLVQAHRTMGNCWADIAKVLPGRTQNGVKNHWHATMRKVMRAPATATPSTPLQTYLREINQRKASGEEAGMGGPSPASPQSRAPGQTLTEGVATADSTPSTEGDAPEERAAEFATMRGGEESAEPQGASSPQPQGGGHDFAAEGPADNLLDLEDEPASSLPSFLPNGTQAQTKGKRSRTGEPRKVANDDFHLRLSSRTSSPEPEQRVPRRRRRRNNAEELAVADGLLCLQEANPGGSGGSETTSQESTPAKEETRRQRRPVARASNANAAAQEPAAATKKRMRQRRMPGADRASGLADWKEGGSNGASGEDGKAPASFLAVIANAAVAIDGLKRVGGADCGSLEAGMIEKALEDPKLAKLRKYVEQAGCASGNSGDIGQVLNTIMQNFVGLPDLWVLYDVLKEERK